MPKLCDLTSVSNRTACLALQEAECACLEAREPSSSGTLGTVNDGRCPSFPLLGCCGCTSTTSSPRTLQASQQPMLVASSLCRVHCCRLRKPDPCRPHNRTTLSCNSPLPPSHPSWCHKSVTPATSMLSWKLHSVISLGLRARGSSKFSPSLSSSFTCRRSRFAPTVFGRVRGSTCYL